MTSNDKLTPSRKTEIIDAFLHEHMIGNETIVGTTFVGDKIRVSVHKGMEYSGPMTFMGCEIILEHGRLPARLLTAPIRDAKL